MSSHETFRSVPRGCPYLELREEKRFRYFCALCIERPKGYKSWSTHLGTREHLERVRTAKQTLLKPNRWPFNDGMFFFHHHTEQSESLPASDKGKGKLLDIPKTSRPVSTSLKIKENADSDNKSSCSDKTMIPGVIHKGEASNLVLRHIGVGKIGVRFIEKDGASCKLYRIWCEWLGNVDGGTLPKHDFAIVTFSYTHNLGGQ